MATSEGYRIGDVIVSELNENFSRQDLTVLASNTFVVGQVGCIDSAGKVVTIANAADDVYTVTLAGSTDAGTFALRYRGLEIAAQNWNVSTADLQTALRALHADLDACAVAGTAGTAYTITVTHEKKSGDHHISRGLDSTNASGTWGGGVTVSRTTIGEHPCVIALEAAASSSDVTRSFLVRDAICNSGTVTGQSTDVINRLVEPKVADDYENQAGYGGISVATPGTESTLPVT